MYRGSTVHQLPTFVLQAWGQLAPVAGQDPGVQARLGLDVSAGTVLAPLSGLRQAAGVQLLDHQGVGLVRQRPTDAVGVIAADPLLLAPQFLQLPPPAAAPAPSPAVCAPAGVDTARPWLSGGSFPSAGTPCPHCR